MEENHEREQYFFDESTLESLASFLSRWDAPCCLCAPTLGRRLIERGVQATILDIDERFTDVPGFRTFDVTRPEWLGVEFDVIVCDPPFFNVSLTQLHSAIRILSRNDFRQTILLAYLTRRSASVVKAFREFELQPTGYFPSYQTVEKIERNQIELFGNIDAECQQRLLASSANE